MNSLNFRNNPAAEKKNIRAAIIVFACVFSLLFSSFAYGTETDSTICSESDGSAEFTEETSATAEDTESESDDTQTIVTPADSYCCVKDETFSIGATAQGKLTYSSGNTAVARVGKASGKVRGVSEGKAVITIRAAATETYREASKTVTVRVYPSSLKPSTVKISSLKATRVRLTWSKVKYATSYSLLKYNVAKKKYVKTDTFDSDVFETVITRNAGRYAVRALCKVNGRTLRSSSLKPVTVTSPAAKASVYKKSRIIRTYNTGNLKELALIKGSTGTTVPQSFCFTGSEYVVSYVNLDGTQGRLLTYDRKGNLQRTGPIVKIGHANGTTYNPNTGNIYTVRTHGTVMSKKCTLLSPDTLKVTSSFKLSKTTSGIAYDESNNRYYLSKGSYVYVTDSSFKCLRTIKKSIRYNHAQDIGAYNGVVLVCTWVSGSTSYVDLYRSSDGAYLGSYSFFFDEIESVVIDDGYLVILMNHVGDNKDHIYKTKERITLN